MLVGLFSILLVRSVVIALQEVAPLPLGPQALAECGSEARRLWKALEDECRALGERRPVTQADEGWTRFRTVWLGELRQAEAHCELDSQQREALRAAFHLLIKVQDLYTTHAVQYAGEVGPTVDRLNAAVDALPTR